MEKTKFDHVNGTAEPAAARFTMVDPATGKARAIKDMTDAELARHLHNATQEMQAIQQQHFQATQNLVSLNALLGLLNYEQDRRRTALAIVPSL